MPRILSLTLFGRLRGGPALAPASPELRRGAEAPAEVSGGQRLWHIRESDAMRSSNWATVLLDTYEGFKRLDCRPHMALDSRGKAVRLLARDRGWRCPSRPWA
ncbi:MAG: hypothetical protein V5A50_06390 [Thiohalorhabdus sp.]|uniref:hypothetical protein n=1 Tax=Thiohalorhabdus sp. TaxID=3094134 RepID=UPI002FC3C9D8